MIRYDNTLRQTGKACCSALSFFSMLYKDVDSQNDQNRR